MRQYLDLLQHITDNGNEKNDRTGTGTRSLFGHQIAVRSPKRFPYGNDQKVTPEIHYL